MADKPVTREEKYLAYLTGDYTGEIPKPITRKEKYLYELCLKGIGGEISPEEIKAAVNEYLEKNPVKPGATTEQAQQIEQNKTDVASLKEGLGNIISPNLFNPTDAKENTAINQDDGTEMLFDGWIATGYIPISKGEVLYFSSNGEPTPYSTGAFYDKDKQRVDSFGNPNANDNIAVTSDGYARFSFDSKREKLQIEKGSKTAYVPYGEVKIKADVDNIKEDLAELGNKILYEECADLLHGKEPKEKWYIDASNGTGRTLAQFFSYINIDVSEYIGKKLYPYTSHKGTTVYHSSRSVVFYDESGTFISGTGISSNNPINGIEVPKKSKTVSVCFNYDSDDNQPIKPQVYYLAINKENKNKLMLKNDISIGYEQIQNKPIIPTKMSELENDIVIDSVNGVQTIRKPTISFIFDDGLPSTSDLVSLFDSYGWKCGFAILANSNLSNIKDNFLSYQSKGYEILSHSTDGVAMQDGSLTIDDVETKMKKSKEILINNGFNITGWVTPSTWLNNKYFDNLCKYYEYGFGHLDTNQVVNHHTFWGNDIRQLERWSLQSKTLEQTKAEIDSIINECGYLCFYAHAYPSTVDDNFTVENMKIIMDYIKKYIDNGKVQVLTPKYAINDYYTVRHSDLLNLYKKVLN